MSLKWMAKSATRRKLANFEVGHDGGCDRIQAIVWQRISIYFGDLIVYGDGGAVAVVVGRCWRPQLQLLPRQPRWPTNCSS